MVDNPRDCFHHIHRAVVKVGSNILTRAGGLNLNVIQFISRQICQLMDKGLEIILVSSGAQSSGMAKLGLDKRPDEIPKRQAVAAVGQAGLMIEYERAFLQSGKKVAQILLTNDGLNDRKRYLNARNTLNTLLEWRVVPIINENDTVSVEELKFGDNDNLSALITLLMDADILINLTDIDGLYDSDPRVNPGARLLSVVPEIHDDIVHCAGKTPGALGTGGMLSKIHAAEKVTTAGIPMVIARGDSPDILIQLFSGRDKGTFFVPRKEKLSSRKCWIGLTVKPEGTLQLDDGATEAIINNGKSLLPGGIVNVGGNFDVGSPVVFQNQRGENLGTGLVNYSADEIRSIMGLKTHEIKERLGHKPYDEVIHRDNLVVTHRLHNGC